MPKATVSRDSTEKIELKSCPGAYIQLRRLSYGEYLRRQEMAMEMGIKGGSGKTKDADLDLKMMQRVVQEFEFKNCIVDHNLEDDAGEKMDFRKSTTFDILDPKIGQEVSTHIDKLIQFEDDLGN